MHFNTVDSWLAQQKEIGNHAIMLGLDRVRAVFSKLRLHPLSYLVITVGGTNGKGSCVAFLDAILRAAGYKVGTYTSPHLLRYNERICINGVPVDDSLLCQTLFMIDTVRCGQILTYFEFSTLAALEIFKQAKVDVAVLEVGLGGRLDAVNVIDADAALIVSIGFDHVELLGTNLDSIAYEKAGIYRAGKPAICADFNPPKSLLSYVDDLTADFRLVGRDYSFFSNNRYSWSWYNTNKVINNLPLPVLQGSQQLANAAAVIETLSSLQHVLPSSIEAISYGIRHAYLRGRFQIFPGPVTWILDVAHNPSAAKVLANHLDEIPNVGTTLAVVGILSDKDARGILLELSSIINYWYLATISGPRGRLGTELRDLLYSINCDSNHITICSDVLTACFTAKSNANFGDRIVVFGSFHTVEPVLVAQPWCSNDT